MYRQKKYIMGNFLEVEIFPMSERSKPYSRAKREKESSPAQKKLNSKKSQRHFNRLAHINFTENDLFVDLTFNPENLPKDRSGAIRAIKNYIARVKRYRKKHGLSPIKYIYTVSSHDTYGEKKRLHVHMIMSGMDRDAAEKLWGLGYCDTDRLQFNECGVTGKVLYMARQEKGERTWASSKNLKKPEPIVSDKAITRAKAEKMERNPEDREFFEKMFKGWTFTDCIVEHMDEEGLKLGTSFLIRMRKSEIINKKKRKKQNRYSKPLV